MSVPGPHPSTSVRWVRNPDVLVRRGGFGLLLLAPTAEQPVLLEGTGLDLWDALDRPRCDIELIDDLASAFRTEPETVATDVRAALAVLDAVQLVVPTVP